MLKNPDIHMNCSESEKLTMKEYWALIYRLEMKKTMRAQLELV